MSSRRDIRTNKAAKLMIQQIGAGEVLSGWQPEPGGARKFLIGDNLEEYGWGAVWPLFHMDLVEEDLITPDGFIDYRITDAGCAYLAKRAQAKAA